MATNLVADAAPAQAAEPGTRPSSLMRAVNTSMRAADANAHDPIAFFCECRNATCFVVCWMTRAAYDAHTEADAGWILSEGHNASEPWAARRPVPRSPETASPIRPKSRNGMFALRASRPPALARRRERWSVGAAE